MTDELQHWPLDKFIEYARNPRKNDHAVDKIAAAIREFGFRCPVLAKSDGTIVDGHLRYKAARKLQLETVPVMLCDDMTEAQIKAFRISVNRMADLAEWDMDLLKLEIEDLKDLDFDLDLTGFDDDFISGLTETKEGNEGLTDPDDVPEKVETRCKPGDLWLLGEHRLLCGDSTDILQVERLMAGEKADMVFTDPPYGMGLDANYGKAHKNSDGRHSTKAKHERSNSYRPIEGDDKQYDPGHLFVLDCEEMFLFGADYYAKRLPEGGSWVVWDKRTTKEGDSRFDAAHGSAFELCWSRQKHKREIARILHCGLYSVENDKRQHPTQKPVKLAEWFFDRWGKPNDLVVDLFLGSGSTLIACQKTGRKCYACEIDPHYVSVAIERWMKFTGKMAYRIEDDGSKKPYSECD